MNDRQTVDRLAARWLSRIAYGYSDPAEYVIAMRDALVKVIRSGRGPWAPEQQDNAINACWDLKKALDKGFRPDPFGNLKFKAKLGGKRYDGSIVWDRGVTWLKLGHAVFHEPAEAVHGLLKDALYKKPSASKSPAFIRRRRRVAGGTVWPPDPRRFSRKMIKFFRELEQELMEWGDLQGELLAHELAYLMSQDDPSRDDGKNVMDLLPDAFRQLGIRDRDDQDTATDTVRAVIRQQRI